MFNNTSQVWFADAESMRIPKIYHFGSLSSVPEGEANCVPACLSAYSNLQYWLAVREQHDKAQPTLLSYVCVMVRFIVHTIKTLYPACH